MVEQALMGIKTAEGKQNFKSCLHFLNFKLKVVGNEEEGGSGKCQMIDIGLGLW